MKPFFRQFLLTLALAAIIYIVLQFTFQSTIVLGSSMEPNLHDNQRIIVNRVSYRLHDPQRGDIITLDPPIPHELGYVKRIIAVPGDTVEIKAGKVYINGKPASEPYIIDPPDYTLKPVQIPPGSYFVLGDNRNNSNDSHFGWLLPRQNIIGKVWLSIWPPDAWGIIPHYSLP